MVPSSGRRRCRRGGARALLGAVAALRLEPDARHRPLVDRGSAAYRATQDFERKFGDDAGGGPRQGRPATSSCSPPTSAGCWRSRAASRATSPGGKVITDEPAPAAVRGARRELDPAPGGLRRRRPSSTSPRSRRASVLQGQSQAAVEQARAAAHGGARSAPAARASAPSSSRPPRSGRPGGPDPVPAAATAASRRSTARPGCRGSTTRPSSARSSSTRRGRASRSRASRSSPSSDAALILDPAAARTSASPSAARRSG